MKIIVLGAGVIGISSAYFLAKAGNEVVVIDKEAEFAMGCSHANGGQLSYSHIETWNDWALQNSFSQFASLVFTQNSSFSFKDLANKKFYQWLFEFWCFAKSNKNSKTDNQNSTISEKIHLINSLSRLGLAEILKDEKLNFDYQSKGILHFFTNQKSLENEALKLQNLESVYAKTYDFKDFFVDFARYQQIAKESEIFFVKKKSNLPQFLNSDECVALEPSLVKLFDEKKLAGGVFFGSDASGDSAKFCQNLAEICSLRFGVKFLMNHKIHNLFTNYKKITGIHTESGVLTGDAYLYCLGAGSDNLLKGVGIDPKIYPVKGYSLSIPCEKDSIAPNLAMTDCANRFVYSRIGNIFRIAGAAEFSGNSKSFNRRLLNLLYKNLRSNFSDLGNIEQAEEWQGSRPFRPNSLPLIGRVKKFGNLFLNVGHGSLGWTMACGSAKIIANVLADKKIPDDFSFLTKELESVYSKAP